MVLDGEPAWPQRLAALALSDLGRRCRGGGRGAGVRAAQARRLALLRRARRGPRRQPGRRRRGVRHGPARLPARTDRGAGVPGARRRGAAHARLGHRRARVPVGDQARPVRRGLQGEPRDRATAAFDPAHPAAVEQGAGVARAAHALVVAGRRRFTRADRRHAPADALPGVLHRRAGAVLPGRGVAAASVQAAVQSAQARRDGVPARRFGPDPGRLDRRVVLRRHHDAATCAFLVVRCRRGALVYVGGGRKR